MVKFSKENILKMFLSYVNDFVSVSYFAEHHNLTEQEALSVIARGRVIHFSKSPEERKHFTSNQKLEGEHKFSEANISFIKKRHQTALISEHSA